MLKRLIDWINQFSFLGIKESDSSLTKFRKRVLNRTFLIIAFTALLLAGEEVVMGQENVIFIPLSFVFISIALLFLNAHNRFRIPFFVLSFLFPTIFLGIIILYGERLKMDYTISFFIVLGLTLYDNRWTRILNLGYLIILQTFSFYYTSNYESIFAEYVDNFDSLVVLTSTTLGLFILVVQFIRESKKSEASQRHLNEDLDTKNKELQQIIVEKENLNRQLLEKTKDLQRANDFLESYTYITSHDLKTPVRNIASFSDLLQKKLRPEDNKDLVEYLEFIRSGALQINSILNGIVENAQSNRSSLALEPIDCNLIIQEIESQMQLRLKRINGSIGHSALPRVLADKMMFKKVLMNLIDNGLKYSNAAFPLVEISCRLEESMCEFSVTDNGIGIQPQFSEDIFKMFKKLHGVSDFSGSGVGLALCKKIIELHGGKIWLDTSGIKGSTFKFTLPNSPLPTSLERS